MNKNEFLRELENRLKHLPKEDREDALHYYREYFDDMQAEDGEDVTNRVGDPKEVARGILTDCTEKQIKRQKEKGGVKNGAVMLWMILLGICAAPIALPVILVILVLFLCLLIVLFSIVFSIVVCGACVLVGAVAMLPGLFWAVGIGQKLVIAGYVALLLGVGVLLLVATIKLSELFVRFVAWIFRKCFSKKEGK